MIGRSRIRASAGGLFALTLACGAAAQNHTGGWGYTKDGSVNPSLCRVDDNGVDSVVMAAVPVPSRVRPALMMARDNRQILAIATPFLVEVDLVTSAVRATRVAHRTDTWISDVIVDGDGSYVALIGQPPSLVTTSPGGAVTTIVSSALKQPWGLTRDIDTGDLFAATSAGLIRISETGAVSTVFSTGVAFTDIDQDIRTGDLFLARWNHVVRADRHGTATTILRYGGSLTYVSSIHMDRASAATQRLVIEDSSVHPGIHYVDLASGVLTTLAPPNLTGYRHVFPYRGRNVVSIRTAPERWKIELDFPGQAGNGYLVALSASGVRPGVPLADGRHICLNPDALTLLSLGGLLGRHFTGRVGRLDGTGHATAVLDTHGLWLPGGARIWIQAITLDPNAPLGIHTVADPQLIRM